MGSNWLATAFAVACLTVANGSQALSAEQPSLDNPAIKGLTAQRLMSMCLADEPISHTACRSYLRGIVDALRFTHAFPRPGFPNCNYDDRDKVMDEVTNLFESWMLEHSSQGNEAAGRVVIVSIITRHPCNASQ